MPVVAVTEVVNAFKVERKKISPEVNASAKELFNHILNTWGMRGPLIASTALVARVSSFVCCYYAAHPLFKNRIKQALDEKTQSVDFIAHTIATGTIGTAFAILSNPFDATKTRQHMELQHRNSNKYRNSFPSFHM